MTAVVAAIVVVAACSRKALGVILDIPEPAPGSQIVRQQPVAETADTVRPPIEALSDPDSVRALLPKDQAGNIDWVAALRTETIRPRANLPGEKSSPGLEDFGFDFLLKGPAPMFDAYFPHSAHVEWVACQTCHPRIFPYRDEPITMQAINAGEACGRCHGTVAFPVATACERCHRSMSMPAGRAPADLIGDVLMARGEGAGLADLPPARFPHWVHRIRYRCTACHPGLFDTRAGADTVTMDMISEGQACGSCHNGRDAFSGGFGECHRCHVSEPAPQDSRP